MKTLREATYSGWKKSLADFFTGGRMSTFKMFEPLCKMDLEYLRTFLVWGPMTQFVSPLDSMHLYSKRTLLQKLRQSVCLSKILVAMCEEREGLHWTNIFARKKRRKKKRGEIGMEESDQYLEGKRRLAKKTTCRQKIAIPRHHVGKSTHLGGY